MKTCKECGGGMPIKGKYPVCGSVRVYYCENCDRTVEVKKTDKRGVI